MQPTPTVQNTKFIMTHTACMHTYTELKVGLLIKIYSGDHMPRLFIHIKYTGGVRIRFLVQLIAH